MGFFRSDSRPHTKSRFSFRRSSDDAAELLAERKSKQRATSTPAPPPTASASASVSARVSTSAAKPSATGRKPPLTRTSVAGPATATASATARATAGKRSSDSSASTDTEDADDAELKGDSADRGSETDPMAGRGSSAGMSPHHQQQPRHSRHSLVGYRQLQFSMTYKNRVGDGSDDATGLASSHGPSSSRRMDATTRASLSSSFLHSGGGHHSHSHSHRTSNSNSNSNSNGNSNGNSDSRGNGSTNGLHARSSSSARASGNGTTRDHSLDRDEQDHEQDPHERQSQRDERPRGDTAASASSERLSERNMTEASVAALQTRRAFQQMVLALEDEDSDEDSDTEFVVRPSGGMDSSGMGMAIGSGNGVMQLGVDEYRKFQFRLRQLEDLCQEQARKQNHMEDTIELEVETRTRKVVAAMEKKIAMYKQAKDLECEREVMRRSSEFSASTTSTASLASTARSSGFIRNSTARSSGGGARDSGNYPGSSFGGNGAAGGDSGIKGTPLDKLLHPRRTRRRRELKLQQEEQRQREMEQFREFIRNTENLSTPMGGSALSGHRDSKSKRYNSSNSNSNSAAAQSARASIRALGDPEITEELLQASPNELIELVCTLRRHVNVQETQLDEAKRLILAAMEARDEAETTAAEAVELSLQLDSRLERAGHELDAVRDELRRSSRGSASRRAASNGSFASFRSSLSPPSERADDEDEDADASATH